MKLSYDLSKEDRMNIIINLLLVLTFIGLLSCQEKNTDMIGPQLREDQQLRDLSTRHQLKPNEYVSTQTPISRLGEKLFNDKGLSSNQDISCLTCHGISTTESISLSIGTGGIGTDHNRTQQSGAVIRRNSQSLFNLGQNQKFAFHDGRVQFINGNFILPEDLSQDVTTKFKDALDAQTIFPVLSREEMRGDVADNSLSAITNAEEYLEQIIEQRLLTQDEYILAFKEAYPTDDSYTAGHLGRAMGSFIRNSFNVVDTNYDRYLKGDDTALTASQKNGFRIFLTKGQCIQCHNGVNLTDNDFHSVGVPHIFPKISSLRDDIGRAEVTNNPSDNYKFKTPGLRNLTKTAPYMHNGSFTSLESVVDHYNNIAVSLERYTVSSTITKNYKEEILKDENQARNQERFNQIDKTGLKRGLRLTRNERSDLVNFLKSMSK
jgi:cytochrome c peroxidase